MSLNDEIKNARRASGEAAIFANLERLEAAASESSQSGELLNCACLTWCRDPALTDGVMTKHHQNCPKFEGKKKFAKITLVGGGTYIQPLHELHSALDGELDGAEHGTTIIITLAEMYQEQYDAMQEFHGN